MVTRTLSLRVVTARGHHPDGWYNINFFPGPPVDLIVPSTFAMGFFSRLFQRQEKEEEEDGKPQLASKGKSWWWWLTTTGSGSGSGRGALRPGLSGKSLVTFFRLRPFRRLLDSQRQRQEQQSLSPAPISPIHIEPPAPSVDAPLPASAEEPIALPTPPAPVAVPPLIKTPPAEAPNSITMSAENELRSILQQLKQILHSQSYSEAPSLLSRAKILLLNLKALLPTSDAKPQHLLLARETLELGAIISIRVKNPESFTRYFQQLQPFYDLPASRLPHEGGNMSKVTGLYLMLLLSLGDYAGFHMLLENLAVASNQSGRGWAFLEDDEHIQYPVRLEQALMEGSYDRVWGETKSERIPGPEFAVFSEVC
jgi:hypothetical protein